MGKLAPNDPPNSHLYKGMRPRPWLVSKYIRIYFPPIKNESATIYKAIWAVFWPIILKIEIYNCNNLFYKPFGLYLQYTFLESKCKKTIKKNV